MNASSSGPHERLDQAHEANHLASVPVGAQVAHAVSELLENRTYAIKDGDTVQALADTFEIIVPVSIDKVTP